MSGSSTSFVWISTSAHNGRDARALGPRAIMHIDQLRSQESFSAHFSLSLAVNCALYKLLYKIFVLTYVSIPTYTTQVSFHALSRPSIKHHTTHRVLSFQCARWHAARGVRKWRAHEVPRGQFALVRCGARAAELNRVFEQHRRPRSHRQLSHAHGIPWDGFHLPRQDGGQS